MKLDEDEEEEIVIVDEEEDAQNNNNKEQIVIQDHMNNQLKDNNLDNSQNHNQEIDKSQSPKKHNQYRTMQHDQLKYTPNKTPRHSELNISRESPQNGGSIQPKRLERLPLTDLDQKPHDGLIKQIEHQDQDQQYRIYIDQFVTRFSKDQNNAIEYLIQNGIIQDDHSQIAKILLTTEGLNKDAINKYFCSTKQRNQAIFEAYCELLNIKNISYLDSMRILMHRFRLSGEAEQVDRLVKTFARVYHRENPTVFENDEIPYIMAYSFIMLSTDTASTKIAQKNKMTKKEFVKNNLPVFKSVPASFFEQVYDEIVRQPFSTNMDYIEQMYNRMTLCNEPLQGDQIKKYLQQAFDLMKGQNLIKFGRYGAPKPRKIFLSSDEKRICWRSIDNDREPARYINVSDVYDLALGCNTTEIMRKNQISIDVDMMCFSIITNQRTLDIQVNEQQIKSKWINYLRAVIITRREEDAKKASLNLNREKNEQKRDEIWKTDILPYWNSHWDYKRNKPENFKKYISVTKEAAVQKAQNKANASSILASICSCLKKTILLQPIQNRQQIEMNQNHQQNPSEISNAPNNNDMTTTKNKSLLLMILWKLGIPDFVRKTIWPVIIGNKLELTETLYEILKQQSNKAVVENKVSIWYAKSFKLIKTDILNLKELFPHINIEKEQQLSNILHAFVFQRPDFGYIQGMGNLASILVYHLSEYDSFQAFVNLIHQHHFLPIFTGDVRQIEWRIRYFEENLERILPLVYIQLKAINVVIRVFLIRWFLTIYASLFQRTMLSRLWDNFLLEGEIYLFKVGISYIKYFQLELKMSNLDEVQRILTQQQPNINEDYFFIQTDEIPIKEDDYVSFIQQQQAALINTQIHQSLFNI